MELWPKRQQERKREVDIYSQGNRTEDRRLYKAGFIAGFLRLDLHDEEVLPPGTEHILLHFNATG